MTIKKYWVPPCNLSTEKELEEYVRKSNNEVRDNLDIVIKLSDLKKEIDTTFSKYEDKIWHFTRKGNETLHELKGELEKNLFGSGNEVPSSSTIAKDGVKLPSEKPKGEWKS